MEEDGKQDGHEQAAEDNLRHRQILLRAQQHARGRSALREEVCDSALDDADDDTRHREQSDDARHREHADADVADVLREDRVDRCIGEQHRLAVDDHRVVAAEIIGDRDADEPREERASRDDGRIAQAREVADAEQRRVVVETEDELVLVREHLAPVERRRRQELLPPAERVEHEVVDERDCTAHEHDVGLRPLIRLEHLRRRTARREWVDTVHLLAEVAAEDRRQKDAEHTAEHNRDGHLEERDIFDVQDVERRQDEHRAADDIRTGTRDGLDGDRLREGVPAVKEYRHAHGQHRHRCKGIDRLPDLQAEIADRQSKEHREK